MSVLHPTLLAAGLAAITLPILIHLLLRRRYVPVAWAAMRFIVEAQKQQRRRRRLEQILLLIARCVLIALIAFAVAHPVLGGAGLDRERTLVLVVDDSLSSATMHESGGTDFDRTLRLANEQIDALRLGFGDRVALISGAAPATAITAAPTGDFDAVRGALGAMRPADSAFDLAGSLEIARGMLRAGNDATGGPVNTDALSIVVTSGWRRGALAVSGDGERNGAGESAVAAGSGDGGSGDGRSGVIETPGTADTGPAGTRVLLTTPTDNERPNLRIRRVSIPRRVVLVDDTPAVREAIVVIDRTGPAANAVEGSIECTLRGVSTPGTSRAAFRFAPGDRETTVSVSLPVRAGTSAADGDAAVAEFALRVSSDDDAVAADSVAFASLRVARDVRAGLVRSRGTNDFGAGIPAASWIAAALRPDESSPVRVREIAHTGLDSASLLGLDLVVLGRPDLLGRSGWETLAGFVAGGGSLLAFVPPLEGAHAWVDDAQAEFASFAGLGREGVDRSSLPGLIPGPASDSIRLLSAELGDLAGPVTADRTLPFETDPAGVVLATADGAPFFVRPQERVWLVTAAISPGWTDLATRPLFPALVQEIARQSPSRGVSFSVTAGVPSPAFGPVDRMLPLGGQSEDRVLSAPGAWRDGLRAAGWYEARDRDGTRMGLVAVSAESDAGDTAISTREGVASILSERGGIEAVWLGDAEDEASRSMAGRSSLPMWAFAGAAGLAVLESLIAVRATRRRSPLGAYAPNVPAGSVLLTETHARETRSPGKNEAAA